MLKQSHIPGLLLIWTLGVLVNWAGIVSADFWWTDETRHAMGGVFFFDFFSDMPVATAGDYVWRYFAQYPALAFNWYPPFFSIVLGLAMKIFGISQATAHATVVGFWLVGLTVWYFWVSTRWGRPTALASSLMLLVVPELTLWSRSVMLDVPAVAMIFVGVYFVDRYLDEPSHGRSIVAGLALSAALLLKQSVVFLIPALLLYVHLTGKGRIAFWRKETAGAILLTSLTLVLLAVHAFKFGASGLLAATVGDSFISAGTAPPRWSLQRWLVYVKALYTTAGPLLLGAALLGLVTCLRQQPWKRETGLLLSWLLVWYVVDTILFGVPTDSFRYTLYVMPVVTFFACYGLYHFRDRPTLFRVWAGAVTIWIAWHAVIAIPQPHHYVSGYEEAARVVSRLPNSGSILIQARNDGNFIFNLRRFDDQRRRVVLRSDKLLVTMSVNKLYGVKTHVQQIDDIKELLQRNAVRWIVVESRDLIGLKEFEMLHELLRTPDYRLIAEIPIRSNRPIYQNMSLQIYENTKLELPEDGVVRLDFPHLGRSFEFQFDAIQPAR
jgi:hypothetical protein